MGLRSRPSSGGGSRRSNGLEVKSRNARKPVATRPWMARNARSRRQRKGPAEERHGKTEDCQNQDPEQQRSLVVAPYAGHLVEQRLEGMGVLENVQNREIRLNISRGQCGKGDHDHGGLGKGGGGREHHESGMAPRGTQERQDALHERDTEGQHQSEMSGFSDQERPPPATASSSDRCRKHRRRRVSAARNRMPRCAVAWTVR